MNDKPDKEFTVYFQGKMTVEAQNDAEATEKAYDALNDVEPTIQFNITGSDEGECADCGGTGEVSAMAQVYPGEPHMADIGTQKCRCRLE